MQCSIDALATYKTNILNTTAHVLYHTHANTEISDRRLSTKTAMNVSSSSGVFDTLGSVVPGQNVVVVNVVGKTSCCSYATDISTASTLLSNFDNWYDSESEMELPEGDDPWGSVTAALSFFCKQVYYTVKNLMASGKVGDSIRSAHFLPLPVAAIGGVSDEIILGQYETGTSATKITSNIFADGCDVAIPWQATDWRRNAPYHEIYLYIPFIGLINISPSDVMGAGSIHISVSVDVTSGDAIFSVMLGGDYSHVIGQYNTNLSAPYAIGSSNISPAAAFTTLSNVVVGVSAAIASDGAAVGQATSGIMGLLNILAGQPSTIGSNSGGASMGLAGQCKCYTIFHDTTVLPSSVSATIGTPTNATLALSTITGYVQTAAASVAGDMDEAERQTINNMLNSGIYIE